MTDGVIDQMKVTNASCVIHYNYPGSKTKFCMRLTTLAETFASSEVILVICEGLLCVVIFVKVVKMYNLYKASLDSPLISIALDPCWIICTFTHHAYNSYFSFNNNKKKVFKLIWRLLCDWIKNSCHIFSTNHNEDQKAIVISAACILL